MNTPKGTPGGPGAAPGVQPTGAPEQPGAATGAGGEQAYFGPQWGAVPPEAMQQGWYGQPAYGVPPYPPHYGYYAAAGPQVAQPPPGQAQAGFEAAFNDMADKSGLGMLKGLFNMDDGDFWKGALVGAAVVLLVTNDELRNTLINGAAKTAEAMKNGLGAGDDEDEVTDEPGASSGADEEAEA